MSDVSLRCPGLSLVRSSNSQKWYIPHNFTANDRTICGACNEKYGITGILTELGASNCDSYYYRNRADNGVFNFSVWSDNKLILYEGTDTGGVKIQPGRFNLLISGYGLKPKEYYTWEIYKNDQCVKTSLPSVYYKSTCLIEGFDGSTEETIVFKIHIYRMEAVDPFSVQGDLGMTYIIQNTVLTEKTGKIIPSYSSRHIGMPIHTDMKRFTTIPLSYELRIKNPTHNGPAPVPVP